MPETILQGAPQSDPASKTPARRVSTDALWLLAILVAASAIGLFVHHSVNQVKEGLPALVLKQQREVANIVHDFSDLAHHIILTKHKPDPIAIVPILERINQMEQRLDDIRTTYNFDNLVGASAIHAVAKPALDDMTRWLHGGLGGYGPDSPQVLRLVHLRADGASRRIRELFEDSNIRALNLVETQEIRLERFRQSLMLYLLAFGFLTIAIMVLFVRQRNAEMRVAMVRKRLADSLENISEGYALYDAEDRLILFNQRFRSLHGPGSSQIRHGATFEEILGAIDVPGDGEAGPARSISRLERIRLHRHPGEPFEIETADKRTLRVSEKKTADGGTVAIYTDITSLKKAQHRLQHLATHDPLTGLPNRIHLQESLEKALRRAQRNRTRLAVLIFDLDHFKLVNDTLGHGSGDDLLREVALQLQRCMRADEIVARLGGDEFAAVLEGVKGWSEASATAERVLDSLSRSFDIGGSEVFVTTSMGIALYPNDGEDFKSLLKNADAACYHAKALGRNNFQFFAEDLNHRATQRLTIEKHLRGALDRGELSLVFQPLVNLADHRVTGMEALLRWRSPELGQVSPAEFIPVAEETGLIIPIGEWVLDQACRQNQAWRSAGLPPVQLSVNVSARQLRLKGFAGVVKRIVQSSGLDPSALVLEITESTIMDNLEHALGMLHEIHASGVAISIDDFGVGYSSLGALKRFPVGSLKIDRSFVADITTVQGDFEIVSAVTAMAHNLRMHVVAEGVETEAQLNLVEKLGCDSVQGYWFGKPMSAETARSFLGEKSSGGTVVHFSRTTGR